MMSLYQKYRRVILAVLDIEFPSCRLSSSFSAGAPQVFRQQAALQRQPEAAPLADKL